MKGKKYIVSEANIGVVISRIKNVMKKAYIMEKPKGYKDNLLKRKSNIDIVAMHDYYRVQKVFVISKYPFVFWKVGIPYRSINVMNGMKPFSLCYGDKVEIMSDRSIKFFKRNGDKFVYKGCIKPLLNTWHDITADNERDIRIFMLLANLPWVKRGDRVCFGAAAVIYENENIEGRGKRGKKKEVYTY